MIRIVIVLIIAFIANNLEAQRVYFVNLENSKPISNVNISSGSKGTVSGIDGAADISQFNINEEVLIQHISYVPIQLLKKEIKDTIFLKSNQYMLKTINLEEIKSPLILSTGSLNKIKRIEIEKYQIKTTADLLKKSMGIYVQESQAGGGSPNFRGMEANRLLIVVDGLALNNAIYRSGHVQSSNIINPFFINNLSVVTGPAAVVYGDGSMGGALIINTISPESFSSNSNIIKQKHESSSSSSALNYIGKYKKNNLLFINGFSIESNNNIRMGNNRYHGYENWGNEEIITEGNEQLKTGYNKYDLIQKTYFVSEKITLNINTQFGAISKISRFDKLNDYEENLRKYKKWYYGPQQRVSQSFKINKKVQTNFLDELSILSGWQTTNESRHKQKRSENLRSNRFEDIVVYDFVLDAKKSFDKVKINYGAALRYQSIKSTANLSDTNGITFFNTTRYPDGGSSVTDGSIYFQTKLELFKNTNIFIGERYNANSLKSNFNNNEVFSLPFSKIETNNNSLVSSFLIYQKISDNITASASFFMGYRNPNVDDVGKVFSKNDVSVVLPNDKLRPEKTNNFEYGVIYDKNKLSLQLQYFKTNIVDAIQRTYSTLNGLDSIVYDGEMMRIQMNQNIESAQINGLNFKASIREINSFSLDMVFNYIKGKTNNDRPLSHIPPANLKIDIAKSINGNKIGLTYCYNSKKDASDFDDNGVDNLDEATLDGSPSWQILNFNFAKNISRNLSTTFSIENIFDAHYKVFGSGISSNGRNFVVSLTSKF